MALKPVRWLGNSQATVRAFALYLATLPEAVYVLHAFAKKTQRTRKLDIELARARLKELLGQRKQG